MQPEIKMLVIYQECSEYLLFNLRCLHAEMLTLLERDRKSKQLTAVVMLNY